MWCVRYQMAPQKSNNSFGVMALRGSIIFPGPANTIGGPADLVT